MTVIIYACGGIAVILGVAISILHGNHQKLWVVWTTFSLTIIVSFGIHLSWDQFIRAKEASALTAEQNKNTKTETDLSDEDIQKIVDGVARRLLESEKTGNAIFGIDKKRIVPARAIKPKNLYVNWETGRIIKNTKYKVSIILPEMHGDIGLTKDARISGDNKVTLHKQVGNKQCPIDFGTEKLCAEVVAINNGITVVSVGIVRSAKNRRPY